MDPLAITDELVQAGLDGDQAQRQRFFSALTHQVRIMINARLNPTLAQTHLAEDLVQETMMALSAPPPRGLASLERRTAAGLRAFASTVVSRRVADALQEKARARRTREPNGNAATHRPGSLDSSANFALSQSGTGGPMWTMLSAGGASPLSEADQSDLFRQVMAALSMLKDEHRTVITLAFFDQLETRDIAEQMGLTRAAASMLVLRAVKALRRHLTGSSQCNSVNND